MESKEVRGQSTETAWTPRAFLWHRELRFSLKFDPFLHLWNDNGMGLQRREVASLSPLLTDGLELEDLPSVFL